MRTIDVFLAYEAAKEQSAKAKEGVAKTLKALDKDSEVQKALDGMLGGLALDEGPCTACGVSGLHLKVCSRCRKVKYCSQSAQ